METKHIHDSFFKEVFSQKAHFGAFAHAALAPFGRVLDWDKAFRVDPSGTDETLVRSVGDLLWRVPLRPGMLPGGSRDGPEQVDILLEHKSHPDPDVVFDVYLRLLRIWTRRPRQRPKRLVVPVVVTNTPRPWDVAATVARAFHAPGPLQRAVPCLQVLHVPLDGDLEARIEGDWDLKAAVRALWVVGKGEVSAGIGKTFEYAARGSWAEGDERFVEALLTYVTSGKIGMDPEALREVAERALRRRRKRGMSTYVEHWMQVGVQKGFRRGVERGRQEGLERGRQEGVQEGLERGRQEGIRASVKRVLERRFGRVPEGVVLALEGRRDLGELEDLVVAASTCESLEEFEALLGAGQESE